MFPLLKCFFCSKDGLGPSDEQLRPEMAHTNTIIPIIKKKVVNQILSVLKTDVLSFTSKRMSERMNKNCYIQRHDNMNVNSLSHPVVIMLII